MPLQMGKTDGKMAAAVFVPCLLLGLYMEKNVARLWLVMSNSSFPYHKQEL
jgi:hypothetical protein